MNFKTTIFALILLSLSSCPGMELRNRKIQSKQELAAVIKENEQKKIDQRKADHESSTSKAVECTLGGVAVIGVTAAVALHSLCQ